MSHNYCVNNRFGSGVCGGVPSPDLDHLPATLAGHAGYLLVRLGKHAQRLFSARIAALSLRPAHADVLFLVADRGPLSQVAIADTLTIERAHLVGLLDQLQDLGLVERRADPGDRRRHAVVLTEAGAVEVGRLSAFAREVEDELLGDLAPAERVTFRETLRRLARDADEGE